MAGDRGAGGDALAVDRYFGSPGFAREAYGEFCESGRERSGLLIRRWDAEQVAWTRRRLDLPAEPLPRHFAEARCHPYLVTEHYSNLICFAGWKLFFQGVTGSSPTQFSSSVGRIGVGTGTGTAAGGDTALGSVAGLAAGNNWILCGAAPTLAFAATPCTMAFSASFASGNANGAWSEFAVDQGTASASNTTASVAAMVNHTENVTYGTKVSGQVWAATATLSFT